MSGRELHFTTMVTVLSGAMTVGGLFAAGDLLAQYMDGTLESPKGYNVERSVRGFTWACCIFTPIAHVWYNKFLERVIPGATMESVVKKVALDQGLFGPVMNAGYLAWSVASAGGSKADVQSKLERDLWPVLKLNWAIWPAYQMVNFKFVPPALQIPFINVGVLGWSTYLALVASKDSTETKPAPTQTKA